MLVKKLITGILMIMMVVSLVAFTGCGNETTPNVPGQEEQTTPPAQEQPPAQNVNALVGTWEWDLEASYVYVFNADGTGTRGIPAATEEFTWESPASGRLNLDTGVLVEEWNYTIDGRELTIDSRQVPGLTITYIRR